MLRWLKKKEKKREKEIWLSIEGMHCPSCAISIDGALEEMEGVVKAETNYAKGVVRVVFDPKRVRTEELQKAILQVGYKVKGEVM